MHSKSKGKHKQKPVIMAVKAVPSIPSLTCSAVSPAQKPDSPFPPNLHILSLYSIIIGNDSDPYILKFMYMINLAYEELIWRKN